MNKRLGYFHICVNYPFKFNVCRIANTLCFLFLTLVFDFTPNVAVDIELYFMSHKEPQFQQQKKILL